MVPTIQEFRPFVLPWQYNGSQQIALLIIPKTFLLKVEEDLPPGSVQFSTNDSVGVWASDSQSQASLRKRLIW